MIQLPSNLTKLFPAETGIQVVKSGNPVILGPVMHEIEWHPLVPFFLTMGKLIHLRRLAEPEPGHAEPGFEQQFRKWMTAYADQIVDGDAEDYSHHIGETRGIQLIVERTVEQVRSLAQRADDLIIKLFEGQVADDLWLNPADTLAERVDGVISYMEANDIGLEDRAGGYRDYLMELLSTPEGLPAIFPTASNPKVLDEWIADQVVPLSRFAQPQ